jgi:hypothetical protein
MDSANRILERFSTFTKGNIMQRSLTEKDLDRADHLWAEAREQPCSTEDMLTRLCEEQREEIKRLREGPDARIVKAIQIAVRWGSCDAAHHKAWVIDQMVRALAEDMYDAVIVSAKAGEDGPETYDWEEGTPP